MRISLHIALLVGASSLAISNFTFAQGAYLPEQGELVTTFDASYENYDSAWLGNAKRPDGTRRFPHKSKFVGEVKIQNYRIALDYGITENLAVDFNTGYGFISGGLGATPNIKDKDGTLDTSLGLRYKLISENPYETFSLPTLAIRAGGIFAGSYDEVPQSLGDGASGWEVGVAAGRYWATPRLGVLAEVNYRDREGIVPTDYYGSLGAYKLLGPIVLSGTYRFQRGKHGWDTGEGDALGRKEDFDVKEFGIGYLGNTGNIYQLSYSDVFDGRNTADRQKIEFSITVPTQLSKLWSKF